ncbi:type IV pilus assembly protein PilM [Jatrophihabitans sp. GAS493]|uniref:type IV pilus assembly protein PilM n=1 Tax=Jatrophihabitans sp. GAS493 TaxID=1907575 RepID=UPI000BB8D779|nr:type IV pilus assembly protein PilM [Jatrophihabitans sp. GAS493]SOD74776.1 type IV pilus assembly protein PilM [Jatrophihabitans sp. GAS493]
MAALALTGLDIGSTSIRAIEATRTKDQPIVTNFGQLPLPEGAVVAGVVQDEDTITNALRLMWNTQNFKSKQVVLGVNNQQIVVREIDLPNLSAKERRLALPFQVRDIVPFSVEDALLDFYPLEQVEGAELMHGLLIAVPKAGVLASVRAVEKAGLTVNRVDLASFAALRASTAAGPSAQAVVDLGAHATNLIVYSEFAPRVVRTIPRGAAEITSMIAARLGANIEEAESLKRRVGLDATEGPETADVVAEALRPLVNEIRSSFAYFRSTRPTDPVSRLALFGGGAQLPGLAELLTRELKVETYVADPLVRVQDARRVGRHDAMSRFESAAAVSVGLTLGAA